MNKIHKYALITDDPIFGSVVSSYFNMHKYYFPIISLPRMERPDWQTEVLKRVFCINRAKFETIFCKHTDYGLLAPLREELNVELIPIDEYDDLYKFTKFQFPTKKIHWPKKDYLNGLIISYKENCILELNDENCQSYKYNKNDLHSETLVMIEVTNEITDITAINYALSNNYSIKFINPIKKNFHQTVKKIFNNLSSNHKNYIGLIQKLKTKIKTIINYKDIEAKYKNALFVVSETPLGILIQKIPIAHLRHLQSDLCLLDENYYSELQKNENILPSFLFVDLESKDLTSEIPEITNDLNDYKIYKYNLNGKYATNKNFKLYSQFFPFDLLFVSGHGSSPKVREVLYGFHSRDGKNHTIKLWEYYQFGERIGDKILVETKEYPLEIDGISWDNKKTLQSNETSHLLRDYIEVKKEAKVIEAKMINPKQIEGLLLRDGIFLGNILNFTRYNNPIIFLNTCESHYGAGNLLNFAGARGVIGTMWSIYDNDANIFAKSFFRNVPENSILESFYLSRTGLENDYSKLSYVYFGTLKSFLKMKKNIINDIATKTIMAKRLLKSLEEAALNYRKNNYSKNELQFLFNLKNLTENFVHSQVDDNNELRMEAEKLRSIVDSFNYTK